MDLLIDILKITLPAGLVLYAMYLVVKSLAQKELQEKQLELKRIIQEKNTEHILPIRLQAYERLGLLLERISPTNLVMRLNNAEFSVGLFQHILVNEIRNEFAHNLSQQMYISDEAWLLTRKAVEETILFINNVASSLPEDNNGTELAKKLLETVASQNVYPTQEALQFLKAELRQMF
ncbi:MAG: hypothetical protein NZ551_07780 [Microscillaceae bacterium]|nr:hypothetical protein [Microscillaceae bacterium]MDW8461095.1 hypothetical protein [Cytophagales bacterium]